MIQTKRTDFGLETGDRYAAVPGQKLGGFEPRAHLAQVRGRFQGIAGRRQPPQPIQPQAAQSELRYQAVAVVRRIERAAEQADRLSRRESREAHESAGRRARSSERRAVPHAFALIRRHASSPRCAIHPARLSPL
jgi:hypothetical protein